MKRIQMIVLALAGLLLLGVAVYYWVTPAGSLLTFMPGYVAGSTDIHLKHGLAALVLALGSGVLLWFLTGKREAANEEQEQA